MPTAEQMEYDALFNPEFAEQRKRQNAQFQEIFQNPPTVAPRPQPRPTLIVLCGLPRSGKSTYAQITGHPIVSPDAIRLALHGERFNPKAEPFVWATAQTMVRALFEAGHKSVVVDACNVTQDRRAMWEHPDWVTEFVYVATPEHVCLERAESKGDKEIIPVIERMSRQWEDFKAGQSVFFSGPTRPKS